MHRTPSRGGHIGAVYDTPRGFGDEPLSVDQELAIELESVKKERQQLMDSIAQVKAEAGTRQALLWQHACQHFCNLDLLQIRRLRFGFQLRR